MQLEHGELAILKGTVVRHGGGHTAPSQTRRPRPDRTGTSADTQVQLERGQHCILPVDLTPGNFEAILQQEETGL